MANEDWPFLGLLHGPVDQYSASRQDRKLNDHLQTLSQELPISLDHQPEPRGPEPPRSMAPY